MTAAAFIFDIGGSECVSTLDATAVGGATDLDVAGGLRAFMESAWLPWMATQCTFREVRFGEAISVSGDPGEGETNALPANCALIMQKNTGTSVKGRMFLPGLAEADCDAGGRVGAELRALVQEAFDDAQATLASTALLKVVSQTGAGSATTITSWTARPLVATLRNRIVTR